MQVQYKRLSDPTYTYDGWLHGSDLSDIQPGNWTATSPYSVVNFPMTYFEKETGTLAAFAFKELIYANATATTPSSVNLWVLMTLNDTAQNWTLLTEAQKTLLKTFTLYTESNKCLQVQLSNTKIIGFAHTANETKIKSLQPLYYSEDNVVCSCLAKKADMTNVTLVAPEPYLGQILMVKLLSGGYFAPFKYALIVGVSILGAVMLISTTVFMCNLVINAPT